MFIQLGGLVPLLLYIVHTYITTSRGAPPPAFSGGFHATPFGVQLALAPLLPSLLASPDLVASRRWPCGWSRLRTLCDRLAVALTEVLNLFG